MMDQLVNGIASNRSLVAAEVRGLVDQAPLFAPEALERGLVDHLGYRDEVYESVRGRVGDGAVQQFVGRYARPKLGGVAKRIGAADTVALVHVTGPIHLGPSGRLGLAGATAGSDTVVAALRSATKAPEVKAVVLRVASPGGSYVASDAIWRQVALTREAGKPVVVSMGDVAASGGYFVSMGADQIVAEPATLTGSIGVVAGKQVVEGLVERLGIGHDHVAEGRHALMFSTLRAFSDAEWDHLNAWLDRIYDDFTAKVAAGRRLPADRLDSLARGRVWTGADAKERGLVDEIGGLRAALELARERAGLPASADIEPRTVSPGADDRPTPACAVERGPGGGEPRLGIEAWGPFAESGDASRTAELRPADAARSRCREAVAHRPGGDLGAARHAELGEDVGDVDGRRPRRDVQPPGELGVAQPFGEQRRHFTLAWRQLAIGGDRRVETVEQGVDLVTSPARPTIEQRPCRRCMVPGLVRATLGRKGAGEGQVQRWRASARRADLVAPPVRRRAGR